MEIGHGRPAIRTLIGRFSARWPKFCCFCHRKTDTGYDLCCFCRSHLPPIVANCASKGPSSVCLNCGFIWSDSIVRDVCAQCVNYRSPFLRIVCPFRYHFPIDGLIGRLKYQQHLPSGRLLGCLLAEAINHQISVEDYPDVLLPVPLNISRYRSRGFNHAAEMAHWCGQSLGIAVQADAVGRRFDTGSMVGLSRAERGMRIRGAFWVDAGLSGRSVAIIDDVLTTGATAGELATELLDQGVSQVQLWAVARTPVTDPVTGNAGVS